VFSELEENAKTLKHYSVISVEEQNGNLRRGWYQVTRCAFGPSERTSQRENTRRSRKTREKGPQRSSSRGAEIKL
jgi:hypothetical protein